MYNNNYCVTNWPCQKCWKLIFLYNSMLEFHKTVGCHKSSGTPNSHTCLLVAYKTTSYTLSHKHIGKNTCRYSMEQVHKLDC